MGLQWRIEGIEYRCQVQQHGDGRNHHTEEHEGEGQPQHPRGWVVAFQSQRGGVEQESSGEGECPDECVEHAMQAQTLIIAGDDILDIGIEVEWQASGGRLGVLKGLQGSE